MALDPGHTLFNGQYRILRLIGQGGFGFVHQAEDTLLIENVAIKELVPALVGDDAALKRFLAEAKATMHLTHDRIVRTYNVFSEGGNYYIVMEYMAGGSMETWLQRRGPLPVDEALRIVAEVCDGLSYAHARGVVHCDLKPANILLAPDGLAKVADFGIAHVSGQMLSRTWHTPAGFVAGTLPYMSPEQADGVRDDPRVDVYALGAVLYRALTGRTYLDFDERETPGAQADNVYRIRSQQPQQPSMYNHHVPAWLDGVVLKALAKQPQDRHGSVDELQAALLLRPAPGVAARPRDEPKGPPSPPLPSSRMPPSRVRRSPVPAWFWPLLGGVTALVFVLAIVAVLLMNARGASDQTATVEPLEAVVAVATATPTSRPSSTPMPTRKPTSTFALTHTPAMASAPAPTASSGPAPTSSPPPTNTSTQSLRPPATTTAAPRDQPTFTPRPSLPPIIYAVRLADRDDYDLYLMDEHGERRRQLTNRIGWNESYPRWSPDGQYLSFGIGGLGSDLWGGIVLLKAEDIQTLEPSTLEEHLIRLVGSTQAWLGNWSPDSRNIVYQKPQQSGLPWWETVYDVWKLNIISGEAVQLTDHHMNDREPSWSPDGQQIAFATNRADGVFEIYVMSTEGHNQHNLTVRTDDQSPRWSPDRRRIAFVSRQDGNLEIYVMAVDGSAQTRLTFDPSNDIDPSWTPDGRILFVSDRDGDAEVFRMNPDGTDLTQLTHNQDEDRWPDWRR